MSFISSTFNPINIFAGDGDVRAESSTFLGGTYAKNGSFSAHTALPALTPLKRDASTYKLVPATALGDAIVGLSMPGFDGVDSIDPAMAAQLPGAAVTVSTIDPKANYATVGGLRDSLVSAAATDPIIPYITHADIFAKSVDPLHGITIDQIYWGYYTTTPANDLQKQSVFDRTGINLKFPATGAN